MNCTTIFLPNDLAYLLDRERRRHGVSTTAIVREVLAAHFNVSEQPRRLRIVGIGHSDLADLGQNDEKYLEEAWGSDEFFEQTMGCPPTPEEKAAAQKHHAIWKPDTEAVTASGDRPAHIDDEVPDETHDHTPA